MRVAVDENRLNLDLQTIQTKPQMAQLRTSESLVKIGGDKTSTLKLSITTPPIGSQPAQAIFYKIKTNHPDLVDAKPIFGVLFSEDSVRSTANIHIRYKGTPQEMLKTRLQIIWIKIESSDAADLNRKKIGELAEMYRQLKQRKRGKEESIFLLFGEEEHRDAEDSDEKREEFRYKGAQQSFEESGNSKKPVLTSLKETQVVQNSSHSSETSTNPQPILLYSFSFSKLVLFFIFSFLFGVLVGMKLEKLKLFQFSNQLQPKTEEL